MTSQDEDGYRPSDPQLLSALDRGWVFRQADRVLRELGYEKNFEDTLAVALYMATGSIEQELEAESESASGSTEGAE